jgi:hypothetical protein
MPHETAVATDVSHAPPASKPPDGLIVLEDADSLTVFQSESEMDVAECLVPFVTDGTILNAEFVKPGIAVEARIDQLFNRLQVLENSCQRIARSVDDLERFVELAGQRVRTVAVETGAGRWRVRLRDGFSVAVDFVRDRGMRDVNITTRMSLRVAIFLIVVLGGAALLAQLDGTGAKSASVSVRPAVQNARAVNIVLAPIPTPTNVLTREAQAPNSTRARKRAARFVGTLIVESKPAGAVVMVDQRKVGTTPARISEVPIGSHALWVVGNDHRRWTTAVTVRASGITRVVAYLDRKD